MPIIRARLVPLCLLLALSGLSCRVLTPEGEPPPPPSGESAESQSTPVEPLPVKKVDEEIVIAAWAEPARLPAQGEQAQLLVRVQKRGGARFPGVEVSLG